MVKINQSYFYHMDIVERLIINFLREGYNQFEISEKLKEKDIKPNSLSSVEKRLKKIRAEYGAKTMFHLAIILSQKE